MRPKRQAVRGTSTAESDERPRLPMPPDEAERLLALNRLRLLDTESEERFDRITRLARRLLGAPIALISLVDEHRQWFKSRQGLDARETSRDHAFCAHAIMSDDTFVVTDATEDQRFRDNPLVCGEPNIRFYAGRPLHGARGHRLGTLCVIDRVPRELSPDDALVLDDLAHIVEDQLNAGVTSELLQQIDAERIRFKTLAGCSPIGIFETDPGGACTYTNEVWSDIAGMQATDALGDGWTRAIHPEDRAAVFKAWNEASSSVTTFSRRFRFQHENGEVRWVDVQAAPVVDARGEILGWVGADQDVTGGVLMQRALAESEERFRQLAHATDDVFWLTDVASHQVLYVSPAYEKVWGRSTRALLANAWDWIDAIVPEDRAKAQAAFDAVLNGASQFEVEFRVRRPDGSVCYILDRGFPVVDESGALIRMAGIATDITELHLAREELRRRAEVDALTGALNAGTLRQLLVHELERSQRSQSPLSVVMIDVDHFKQVNDSHGHGGGDCVLQAIVDALRGGLRASDVVGRLGGDEFCVILPDCDGAAASRILGTIAKQVASTPIALPNGECCPVTLSVGIASTCGRAISVESVLERADEALYCSKRGGRNRVHRSKSELLGSGY